MSYKFGNIDVYKIYKGSALVYELQRPFIITMKTTTASESITMPIVGTTNNYSVDWGDGIITSGHTATATHVYALAGTYDVKISGNYSQIYFGQTAEASKVQNVKQWGTTKWTAMNAMFWGGGNLIVTATDIPDLSMCTTLFRMFRGQPNVNVNAKLWNTSNITRIEDMFRGNTSQKFGFAGWDVSNITLANEFCNAVTLPTSEYDATLIAWSTQTLKTGVVISFGNSKYSSAASTARVLIISKGWTITDGGMI